MADSPLDYRSPRLVIALLAYVIDRAPEPVPWLELIDRFTAPKRQPRTIEGTIYDLCQYGALHKIGKPGTTRQPDTRALKPTILGQHWLEQTPPPPLPTDRKPEP